MVLIPKNLQRWIRVRPRLRVGLQYGGLVMGLLVAALWVINAFCNITYLFRFTWVTLVRGRMTLGWHSGNPYVNPGLRVRYRFAWPTWLMPEYGSIPSGAWITIPLWMPLLVFTSLAIVAWRSHRNRPLHACPKCEYDLTGNVSGVCPECGAKVESRFDAAGGT